MADVTEEVEDNTESTRTLTYSTTNATEEATSKNAKIGGGYAKITYIGEETDMCSSNQEWLFEQKNSEYVFHVPCNGKYSLDGEHLVEVI